MTAPSLDAERHRTLTVPLVYGAMDVERAADSLHVSLSDEETDAILERLDGDLDTIMSAAATAALAARIYEDLVRIGQLHVSSDDD
ncbi:MAG: DUF1380 family protein [Candidatus Dormibacteraeota bacterium]|nr:DUF1380 family protein [Candidatus Dormibacteraeota bacterium]